MKPRTTKEPQYSNLSKQKDSRRHLRRTSTRTEQILWQLLRNRQLGGKRYRRQHGIGPYIVDFFCAEEKLAVELDGEVHDHPKRIKSDFERDRYIENLDIRVLRVRNQAVSEDPHAVLGLIASYFTITADQVRT